MRVAAYYRVSTNRNEQADSIPNQKDYAKHFVKQNGYTLLGEYEDRATGTNFERDGIQNLIDDINNGMFDIVICKELSRIARNVGLQYRFLEIIENKGIRLITLDGTFDSENHEKQGMAGLLAWLYEQEARNTSRRIKQVFKTKAEKGLYLGSLPPYGYQIEDKHLIPRKDETVVVLEDIFDKYLSGWGVDRIATYLTKSGFQTPAQVSGKTDAGWIWHGSSVKKILENPAYVGDLVSCRETTISAINKKRKKGDLVTVPNTHIPLIEREKWERVQTIMDSRKRNRGKAKAKGSKHLFVGFLVCPDCGRGFHFRQNRKGYICGGYGRYGKHVCKHSHGIKEEKLTNLILDDIRTFCMNIDKDNILDKVQKKTAKSEKFIHKKMSNITNKLEKLKRRRSTFINLLADGDISKEEYNEQIAETKAEIDLLEREKASLEDSLNNSNDIDKLTYLKTELEKFLKFDTLTKEMLNLLVDKIEVNKNGEPVIYYRFAPVFEAVI